MLCKAVAFYNFATLFNEQLNLPIVKSRSYSTKTVTPADIQREWFIVDAQGLTLGRMTSRIAAVLRGKHKPTFTPNQDCGDYVIVINSEKVRLTGNKMNVKSRVHHTGYPGGQKWQSPKEIIEKRPIKLIEMAVKGMLPKNTLGRDMYRKLFVYEGPDHPHASQKPKSL